MPAVTLAIGATGHRSGHPSFPTDPTELDVAIGTLITRLEEAVNKTAIHSQQAIADRSCRLVTLLADGVDQMAARIALARDWELTAPLPFGLALNVAINAQPESDADAQAILDGKAASNDTVQERAAAIRELAEAAKLFELADQDDALEPLFLAMCEHPEDADAVSAFVHEGSRRAGLAGRILIEQSDILIAVWDGATTSSQGGTGHTALLALEAGVPVIWIDPAAPQSARILLNSEELACAAQSAEKSGTDMTEGRAIEALVADCIGLSQPRTRGHMAGLAALGTQAWRTKSSWGSHIYRRIESLFGQRQCHAKLASVRQNYERPADVAEGSGKPLLDDLRGLDPADERMADTIAQRVLPRFIWSEGIAAHLSNLYRSGMVINFLLGPTAIIAGVLYLPLVETSQKWIFAGIEFTLLLIIVLNTVIGRRARFHTRWLETRRTAEYLRHLPLMLAAGVARPAAAWPCGLHSEWPEWYAKRVLRSVGLPNARMDKAYVRKAVSLMREHFIIPQRDYHKAKAERLQRAHHGIERFAETMFGLAVAVVAFYLAGVAASQLGLLAPGFVDRFAKWFTVIALALPTISGAFAAIGYFGDFDRFADISQMTVERLDKLAERAVRIEALPDSQLSYAQLADLVRLTDQTTFDEIQSWQAVFSGKRTTVPA